jgi:hypothetical protein
MFLGGQNFILWFLGYVTAYSIGNIPTFRRNILTPYVSNVEVMCSFEISVATYHTTRCHNLSDMSFFTSYLGCVTLIHTAIREGTWRSKPNSHPRITSYIYIFLLMGWDWYCDHYWSSVPAPDDRWWRLLWNWWNEDWQGKPKYSEKTCHSATLSTTNPTWLDPGLNPGRLGGKPATNRLSYGASYYII